MTATTALVALFAFAPSGDQITTKVVTTKIPFKTRYESSAHLGSGKTKLVTPGVPGELKTTYQLTWRNGKVIAKKALFSTRREPEDAIMLLGSASRLASRGGWDRFDSRVMTMTATGYDTSQQTIPGGTGRTATGIPAEFGIAAVDPRVIPLGTRVYVEGYGEALCADTGGAIKGRRIDLCFDSRAEALAWGRRTVKVHILGR